MRGLFSRPLCKWIPLVLLCVALSGAIASLALKWWVEKRYEPYIYDDVDQVPARKIAIVFGAGVRGNQVTPILADRVARGVELYRAGKVKKLLFTGDNRFVWYDEPSAMKRYAMRLGVPEEDIVLDFAGRSTYDSCYRADYIFGVKEAILVTQGFHLARAMYLCDSFGIDVVGLKADQRKEQYQQWTYWSLRDFVALVVNWWQVNVTRPKPVLGEKIEIAY